MKKGFRAHFYILPLAALLSIPAAAADTSAPTLVILRPETSSFWHTATNRTLTLPVEFPAGASSATLTVAGAYGLRTIVEGVVSPSVTVTLPAPSQAVDGASTEDVYTFTLVFDDGTSRTAKLGLIAGLAVGGEGTTRCLAPIGGTRWPRVRTRAVVPVPYGTTALAVDGEPVETGLDGAQGWCALTVGAGVRTGLSATVGERTLSAELRGLADTLTVILR